MTESFSDELARLTEKIKARLKAPTDQEKRQVLILSSFLEELKLPLYRISDDIKRLLPEDQSGLLPSVREYSFSLSGQFFSIPYKVKQSIGSNRIEIMNVSFTGGVNNLYMRFEEPKEDTPVGEWFKLAVSDGSRDDFPRKFVGNIGDLWFNSDGLGAGAVSFNLLVYRNLDDVLIEPVIIEDGGGIITVDGSLTTLGPQATSVIAGSATANAGVSTQLAANACKSITVQAKRSNTSFVEIGGTAGQTIQLDPLMAISLDVANSNLIFFTPQVTGEGVNFIVIN